MTLALETNRRFARRFVFCFLTSRRERKGGNRFAASVRRVKSENNGKRFAATKITEKVYRGGNDKTLKTARRKFVPEKKRNRGGFQVVKNPFPNKSKAGENFKSSEICSPNKKQSRGEFRVGGDSFLKSPTPDAKRRRIGERRGIRRTAKASKKRTRLARRSRSASSGRRSGATATEAPTF